MSINATAEFGWVRSPFALVGLPPKSFRRVVFPYYESHRVMVYPHVGFHIHVRGNTNNDISDFYVHEPEAAW